MWTLDGDPHHQNLLKFALKETDFKDSTVVFVVSMTTPWHIMDQLQNWASILQDHIDNLGLGAEQTKDLQNDSMKLLMYYCLYCPNNNFLSFPDIRRWQSYVEPGDEMDAKSPTKRISRNMEFDQSEELPLPENTLTRNLGLDLIVVVTKVCSSSESNCWPMVVILT